MPKASLLPRKAPRQARSTQMVGDIVRGAIRVLEKQGGRRFTTIRVAEEAGVSVGSLYQYFPNKEAILFQVQRAEWQATANTLLRILADQRAAPRRRLRRMILAFFETEREEAGLRRALAETGVAMEDTDEYRRLMARVFARLDRFLAELDPRMGPPHRRFAARFVFTTVAALAEEVTTPVRSRAEVARWAAACADMILAYLRGASK